MINLQAQGYKIIGPNILQSMLKSKLQIRENVNKQIGSETLFYFASVVRRIFILLIQVHK